jgi:curved DNA-binding protein CbpA
MIDYYEFLQISPHADSDTVHRVYRYLAGRLHPDNPESGDAEMFRMLKAAYDVLSNPARRAEYDAACRREDSEAEPLSSSIDFMDSLEGETNRRVGLLAVLYFRRRTTPHRPEVPLAEIEERMGFPRDYLDFTTWYLVKKGYVTRADNSDFTLTAEGVDYVETQRGNLPVLNKLLTDGRKGYQGARNEPRHSNGNHSGAPSKPIILPANGTHWVDRRSGSERRVSATTHHLDGIERRSGLRDRRFNTGDRRINRSDRRSYALAQR